ncbi:MAG: peptide chain release factor 1 [Verrucomicrobiales bacterium]|nr:peptide chain release factor 1 [Verrucomicrobiales bacterium]
MDLQPHIEKFAARMAEVETELGDPKVFENNRRAQDLGREYARLKELVAQGDELARAHRELEENRELVNGDDPEMAEMAAEEIARLEVRMPELEQALQLGLVPPDPADSRNTIIEIRAGAGGDESALFAGDLFRMYTRYADERGWKHETMSSTSADLGGFKEVVFSLSGEEVYKRLKFESGVHRVQRVPATEASGRIHTSTCTVAVLPEAEEVDVEIKPEELEISVTRASGPGGQGVNTTDSAVQILHKPTGLIVRCMDERSQIKNKAKAMKVLRSRLLDQRIAEEQAKYAAERKSQIGTGERNERIRTYNFPQNRVSDHRIELTLHSLPAFMEGAIDEIIEPLIQHDLEEKLAALTA